MKTFLLANVDRILVFLAIVALALLIGFALRSNAKAHGDGKGEA